MGGGEDVAGEGSVDVGEESGHILCRDRRRASHSCSGAHFVGDVLNSGMLGLESIEEWAFRQNSEESRAVTLGLVNPKAVMIDGIYILPVDYNHSQQDHQNTKVGIISLSEPILDSGERTLRVASSRSDARRGDYFLRVPGVYRTGHIPTSLLRAELDPWADGSSVYVNRRVIKNYIQDTAKSPTLMK